MFDISAIRRGLGAVIFPTVERAAALKVALAAGGPLVYHAGGRIMPTVSIYVIFWLPPKLQSGAPTTLSKPYQDLQIRLMKGYSGHGLANNNTQYSETVGSATNYVLNSGRFVESYVDTAPYPASACKDSVSRQEIASRTTRSERKSSA